MKKNLAILIVFAITAGGFLSCKKKLDIVDPVNTTENLAFLKIIDAAPSFRQITNNRDSFNVYVNNAKINGGFLSYSSVFPTTSNLYVAVPPGSQPIRLTVAGVNTPDSITIGTFNKTLDAGSYYSFIITDSLMKGNDAKQMFLKDNFALTDTSHFTLRFVHAVLNDPGTVDVYSTRNAANIFTNISPATATPFNSYNYTLLSDTLIVRSAGTQTEIARLNGAILNRGRAYTFLYKGQSGGAGTKVRNTLLYANQ